MQVYSVVASKSRSLTHSVCLFPSARSNITVMARSRSNFAPGQQCDGVNRRGVRCGRRVASSTPPSPSTAPGTPRYCTIHHRIAVNRQAAPRVLPPNARQRFRGAYAVLSRSLCPLRLPAQVPPSVSGSTADEIAGALVKGPSLVDQSGSIYVIRVYGACLLTCDRYGECHSC